MVDSSKITPKRQITLPATLLAELGLKPGDRVDFVRNRKGRFEIVPRTGTLEDLKGIVPYDGPPLSDEDIVALVKNARAARADKIMRVLDRDQSSAEEQD